MKKIPTVKKKVKKVMKEFKEDKLHSGSRKGSLVKSRAQALAIALDEGRRATGQKKKAAIKAK